MTLCLKRDDLGNEKKSPDLLMAADCSRFYYIIASYEGNFVEKKRTELQLSYK